MLKRLLSAYNIYFRVERQRCMAAMDATKRQQQINRIKMHGEPCPSTRNESWMHRGKWIMNDTTTK